MTDRSGLTQQAVADEVDGLLNEWRSKAISLVLTVAGAATLPALVVVLKGRIFNLPWPLRIVCALLYLALAIAAVRPRWLPRWRAVLMLGVLATFGVIQLAVTQLAGDGRLSLLVLPLLAVILVGPRTGWWMAGLSCLLFVAVALLVQSPLLTELVEVEGVAAQPGFWFLQGLRFAGSILVLMILLTQFHALQRRTMIAERVALRKVEEETADRKRLETEVARISESERRNLGSELHDGLCQNLTAALLNCTALENRQTASGATDAAEVTRIREEIEESIDTAYDVARGLCPVDLEPEGLIPALEGLCRTAREHRGVACELQADAQVRVGDPDCALQLYRIAGEALTNAAKHAVCTRVVIRLCRRPGELELSVTDDGKGIASDAGEGLGRRIMAYRAGLMGGSLEISGAPGKGTTVLCRMPHAMGAA